MKICMLTWEFPPRIVGGIARHCFGLARALAKENHEVHVVTLEFPGAPAFEDVDGAKVHRVRIELGNPDFVTWTFIFNHFIEKKVAALSRVVGFDLIHVHDWLTAPAGLACKHFLNKHLVATVHSTEVGRAQGLHSPNSYLIDGLEWWMTYEGERVIVCSHSMKSELVDHFRIPPEKITVIPNAVDSSQYETVVDREAVKRRYGMEAHDKIVLLVGRLVPQKGVEHLVNAVPSIVQNNSDAKFIIAGDGWSRNHLENLVRTTRHGDRVRFVGFVSDSELVELMAAADVLVIPSIYEPFGIVALEGMAAGVPVVAANVGGLTEVVDDGKTGLLFNARDPQSLSWTVNKVLSDPACSDWLIRNAKKKVQAYSWSATARRTVETYELALGG